MVGDGELAADYTQDTFIRTFDRLATFRGESALSPGSRRLRSRWCTTGSGRCGGCGQREVDLEHADPVAAPARQADPDLKLKLAAAIEELPTGIARCF